MDTGEHISPGLARKIACEAGIIPAVLDGDSLPLDLGRKMRLHTEHQRYAILLRDQGCRAEGCDRTQGLHTHHQTRWTDGDEATGEHGISLCGWHHSTRSGRTGPSGSTGALSPEVLTHQADQDLRFGDFGAGASAPSRPPCLTTGGVYG